MRRVIAQSVTENQVILDSEEQHHLVRVLRLKAGDLFEAIDTQGRRFRCRLENDHGNWLGIILEVSSATWESPSSITLAQALIKRDKFEWVVQKAVELGVSEIRPLITTRTEIELNERRTGRKMERWNRVLSEAVKQCGRTRVPTLHEPASLREVLTAVRGTALIAPDEAGSTTLEGWLSAVHPPCSCCLFIGPEGGWDEADRALFQEFGVAQIRIGPRIMRAETAAICSLSLLQYELGDLNSTPESFQIDYQPFNQ